jgi:hypothetical protein
MNYLRDKFKTITVHEGLKHNYLGMVFDYSEKGKVKITMNNYIEEVLELCQVSGTALTPAMENLFEEDPNSTRLIERRAKSFHTYVAKLLFLAKRVRPDILLAISYLATRVTRSTEDDWKKLDRVMKYLNGTIGLGITLEVTGDVNVWAYADASYGIHVYGKSHSGLVISLGKGPVFVKSSKQRIVTKSTYESELVATSDSGSQVIWSRDFMINQGYKLGPAILYQDNQATISALNNGRSGTERSRHINVRYFWIAQTIRQGQVKPEYVMSKDMVADIFTKPLQGELFIKLRNQLLNWYT